VDDSFLLKSSDPRVILSSRQPGKIIPFFKSFYESNDLIEMALIVEQPDSSISHAHEFGNSEY
jgi:hypothetical protein